MSGRQMAEARRALARFFAIVSLISIPLWTASGAQETAPSRHVEAQLDEAVRLADRNDCPASLLILKKVVEDRVFASFSDKWKIYILWRTINCSLAVKDFDAAYRHAVEMTGLAPADNDSWRIRFSLEINKKHYLDAVATVEAMATENPNALNALEARWLYSLASNLAKLPDKKPRFRLLTIVAAPGYQPEEPLVYGDNFKREYAALLVEAGDKARAAAALRQIVNPRTMMWVSLDQRVRDHMPADYDFRLALERYVSHLRELNGSRAPTLDVLNDQARYLRALGRPEEGLATLEATRPDGAQRSEIADLTDRENWWYDELARTYLVLGRYDEAVAAYRTAIALKMKGEGDINISQTINLANAQLRFGRADDALATIAIFEKTKYQASAYGEMQIREVRGCAHATQNNLAAAGVDVAYAREHEGDAPFTLVSLLLCTGDMNAAAMHMIRNLDNPDSRANALLRLSDFETRRPTYPLWPDEARIPDLKARPDVKAAIERAGGTRRFAFQEGEL